MSTTGDDNKDVRVNLRVSELMRRQFALAVMLRGSDVADELRRYMAQVIQEEKKKHPDAFNALESDADASPPPEPKPEAGQPKKKTSDPMQGVGFRIIGMGHGNVLDPPNRKKPVPVAEEKITKKKGPRNEG